MTDVNARLILRGPSQGLSIDLFHEFSFGLGVGAPVLGVALGDFGFEDSIPRTTQVLARGRALPRSRLWRCY